MNNKRNLVFIIINIFVIIFFLSTPFISIYGTSFLIWLLCPDCIGRMDLGAAMLVLLLPPIFFSIFFGVGFFLIFILGQKFIKNTRPRKLYYLSYVAAFGVIPMTYFLILLTSNQINKRQREVKKQMYVSSIQIVKIKEKLIRTQSCLDQALILDMDIDVKYEGDYVLSGYIEFDETLPAETGRLETQIANGIRTWPYCGDERRDENGKCDSLLHLASGRNHISVEFPGFTRRLIEIKRSGSFPLKTFYIFAVIHSKRNLFEKLFGIERDLAVKKGGVTMEEYNAYSFQAQSGITHPIYLTNYYDFQEITKACESIGTK